VIENYVEPNYENEAQLADPTLLSIVSVLVIHLFLINSSESFFKPQSPPTFLMKHFSDVIAFGLLSESAKPMWTTPLPSF